MRTVLLAALLFALAAMPGAQPPAGATWRTAWTTSQQAVGTATFTDTTVRLIARLSIGGDSVRVRLDNSYGKTALRIGKASVAFRTRGAALVAGSSRSITFGGANGVTVPQGGTVRSDPVALPVLAHQDLVVSVYVPDAEVQPSQHTAALVTSYAAPANAGDLTAVEAGGAFTSTMTTMPWLKAIDVMSAAAPGVIVAFGDSITDGTCSTIDGHDRWEDVMALRLALDDRPGGRNQMKAVVNEGIGGNTVTREGLQPPPDSLPGIERFERDVLSHAGVTDVVLFMGTNDIRRGAPATQVRDGLTLIKDRLKARGLKVFASTIIPRHNTSAGALGWDDAKTAIRNDVNQWIRTQGGFDGVLDFDAAVRDPVNKNLILPPFNCDGIHPTPRGYYEMGKAVPLELFR